MSRTLRIALAMRGGVSLAVWIGGAVAEIDELRRAKLTPTEATQRRKIYADLLDAADYQQVEVDILAGASAGGLNAVLYGTAQSVGASVNDLANVWCELGAMWRLLRGPTFPGPWYGRSVPSLLKGDDFFYTSLVDELTKLVQQANEQPAPRAANPRVSVHLSATVLAGATPAEQAVRGGRADFTFHGRPGTSNSDLPVLGPEILDTHRKLRRLALAGRATSSFPGAFEPATIVVGGSEDVDATNGQRVPQMRAVFSGSSPWPIEGGSGRRYLVCDGGVFDNIPIDRALHAIDSASAVGPTGRRLLYLDPDPPRDVIANTGETKFAASGWLPVILKALALKQRRESADDELSLLRTRNESVLAARGRQDALAGQIHQALAAQPAVSWETFALDDGRYAGWRASLDSARLARLLIDPTPARREHTTLSRNVLREATALKVMAAVTAAYYSTEIQGGGGDPRPVRARLVRDAQAAADAATLLIVWLRTLENVERCTNRPPTERGASAHKPALYRLLHLALAIRDHGDVAFLAALVDAQDTSVMYGAGQLVDELPDVVPAVNARLSAETQIGSLGDMAANLMSIDDPDGLDTVFFAALPSLIENGEGGGLEELWVALEAHHEALIRLATGIATYADGPPEAEWPNEDESRRWNESLFRLLHQEPLRSAPLERLTTVFASAGGIVGTASIISFERITGDEETPLEPRFEGLGRAAADEVISRALKDKQRPVERVSLSSKSKLAGNTLGNFGGFLVSNWRENDWWWGRCDAASGIVRMLLSKHTHFTPQVMALWNEYKPTSVAASASFWAAPLPSDPLPAFAGERLTDAHMRALWAAIVTQLHEDLLGDRRPEDIRAGGDTLAVLNPAYKLGLVGRSLRLLPRTLRPTGWSVKSLAGLLALLLVRPLLVALSLAAAPLRLGLLVAGGTALLAREHALPDGARPNGPEWAGIGVATIVLAWLGWKTLSAGLALCKQWTPLRSAGMLGDGRAGWLFMRLIACFLLILAVLGGGALLYSDRAHVRDFHAAATWPGSFALCVLLLGLGASAARWPYRMGRPRATPTTWIMRAVVPVSLLLASGVNDTWRFGDDPDLARPASLVLSGALVVALLNPWAHWLSTVPLAAVAVALTAVPVYCLNWSPTGSALVGLAGGLLLVTVLGSRTPISSKLPDRWG